MDIDGIFSGKTLSNYDICIDTYGYLGLKYSSYIDENVKLFLKKIPAFETVFDAFINEPIFMFKSNKNIDICLSLFYKPYFDEFYYRIIQNIGQLSVKKRKYLLKNMLDFLANDTQHEIIVNRNMINKSVRDYYIKKNIYTRSKELISLIKSK